MRSILPSSKTNCSIFLGQTEHLLVPDRTENAYLGFPLRCEREVQLTRNTRPRPANSKYSHECEVNLVAAEETAFFETCSHLADLVKPRRTEVRRFEGVKHRSSHLRSGCPSALENYFHFQKPFWFDFGVHESRLQASG